MIRLPFWTRRSLGVLALAGLTPVLLSQQTRPPQDDSTESQLLEERKHEHDAQKTRRNGTEADDPRARYEWTRRAMGTPTSEYKRRLRREAARKRSMYPQLMPPTPSQASSASSPSGMNLGQPGTPSSASGTGSVPFWIPIGPGG